MTSYPWANKENYAYLKGKTKDNWTLGWAWEFVRRSKKYRATYDSYHNLQKQYGDNWRKQQTLNIHYPALQHGEPDAVWRLRAADMLLVARKLSKSQSDAGQWHLFDLYDYKLPYNEKDIRYDVHSRTYPMFYSNAKPKNRRVDATDCIENDLSHVHHVDTLFVALSLSHPLKAQLARIRPIFKSYKKSEAAAHKGREVHWIKYLQVLDAMDANTKLPMTKIIAAIGVQIGANGSPAKTANGYKNAALHMANEGYKGLLHRMEI